MRACVRVCGMANWRSTRPRLVILPLWISDVPSRASFFFIRFGRQGCHRRHFFHPHQCRQVRLLFFFTGSGLVPTQLWATALAAVLFRFLAERHVGLVDQTFTAFARHFPILPLRIEAANGRSEPSRCMADTGTELYAPEGIVGVWVGVGLRPR